MHNRQRGGKIAETVDSVFVIGMRNAKVAESDSRFNGASIALIFGMHMNFGKEFEADPFTCFAFLLSIT